MDLSRIDLNLLVTFDILVSECSVSRTAEKLNVTQPAVSHALKRLRGLLDDEVLARGPRGLQPTARAVSLQPLVKAVLADVHSLLSTTAAFDPATTRAAPSASR